MAKDPAFLFYASDFLTGTMFFSNEQLGKYIRLLCSQHQHGGLIDKNSFNTLVGEDLLIRAKFTETDQGFYNIRLSLEMENRQKKSTNISDAAKETWKKRKESNTIVIQSYKNRNTTVIRSEDENEDESKKSENYEILVYPTFDDFWNIYDKKVGDREKIKKKFESLSQTDRYKILDHLPKYKESQPDKKFRKDPSTYLNNKSWNDEIIMSNGSESHKQSNKPIFTTGNPIK